MTKIYTGIVIGSFSIMDYTSYVYIISNNTRLRQADNTEARTKTASNILASIFNCK